MSRISLKDAGKSKENWNRYMKEGDEDVRSGKRKGTLYKGGKQVFSNESKVSSIKKALDKHKK